MFKVTLDECDIRIRSVRAFADCIQINFMSFDDWLKICWLTF